MKVRTPAKDRHGYGPYTNGCRCDVCREAKRQRQAHLRDPYRARLRAQLRPGGNVVDGIAHGRSGYDNCYCRCHICCAAKSAKRRRDSASPLTDADALAPPG